MDKEIVQFSLEDGTKFLIEVEEPDAVGVERVAIKPGQVVLQAKQTFEDAIDVVQPVASVLINRLKQGLTIPADEVEVKFGLKLTAEAGAIFTSISGDVNFEITLKWTQEKSF